MVTKVMFFFENSKLFVIFFRRILKSFKILMYLKCETAGVLAVVLFFQIECNMVAGETVVG